MTHARSQKVKRIEASVLYYSLQADLPSIMTDEQNGAAAAKKPNHIFVFDNPRCHSHALGPEAYTQHLNHNPIHLEETKVQQSFTNETYASATTKLETAVQEAEANNKTLFANEHAVFALHPSITIPHARGKIFRPSELPPNPTHLPDPLFHIRQPLLLIRHSALTIPSVYAKLLQTLHIRPGDEEWETSFNLRHVRLLFDFFVAQGRRTVFVDGEEVIWEFEGVMGRVCDSLGLENGCVTEVWDPTPTEELPANLALLEFTKGIHGSCGIERAERRPDPPTVQRATQDCIEKYGEEVGRSLERYMRKWLPDYEYLSQFKA